MSVTVKNDTAVSSHILILNQINIINPTWGASYNQNICNLVYSYMYAVYRNDSVQEIQLFSKENQSGLCSTI